MEGVIGVVTCFGGNFAPKYWQLCQGQLLAINTNQALFSILGTVYGGNGTTNFGLPNLQGRTPIGVNPGATGGGIPNVTLGQLAGVESETLTTANLPAHAHNGPVVIKQQCNSANDGTSTPSAGFIAGNNSPLGFSQTAVSGQNYLQPTYTATIGNAGGSAPFNIMHPYQVVNYIICTQGLFPSRN